MTKPLDRDIKSLRAMAKGLDMARPKMRLPNLRFLVARELGVGSVLFVPERKTKRGTRR